MSQDQSQNLIQSNNLNQNVVTFGCRLNIYESEIIKKNLQLSGLDNVVVFNTCTVTQEAERQARQQIRKIKKENPDIKVIVTGCAAQNNPEMFGNMVEVDKVLGNNEKLFAENYHINVNDSNKIVVGDIMEVKEIAGHLVTGFDGKARAFIQIQNGCDHRCTFCVIPLNRGNSRSVPLGDIVNQVKLLLNQGYKEIVFTGVDITAYGGDLLGTPTLAQMIRRLFLLVPEMKRLRLSSIDVAEIDSDLFNLMATDTRIMPHFHISLQSGDNMILKRMKRRHSREEVINFCSSLREIRKDVAFGADIIVGFPTESDEMFLNTLNLVQEANLQYLHVFPYSPRPNTPAAKMPQVNSLIRKERAKVLRKLGDSQINNFLLKHDNMTVNVLVESSNKGHTDNFIALNFSCDVKDGSCLVASLKYFNTSSMIAIPFLDFQ